MSEDPDSVPPGAQNGSPRDPVASGFSQGWSKALGDLIPSVSSPRLHQLMGVPGRCAWRSGLRAIDAEEVDGSRVAGGVESGGLARQQQLEP